MNGQLMLRGLAAWHEWHAVELLDVCEVFMLEDIRHAQSLGPHARIPHLPDVDVSRLAVRGCGVRGWVKYTPPIPTDDGTWGTEEDSWQPPDEGDGDLT